MRNFIGNLLIGLAAIIKFLHNVLIFSLLVGIVMGIVMITMIAFFDLLAYVLPIAGDYQMNVLKKPVWDIIALLIGGGTMWVGFSKAIEGEKKEKREFENRKTYLNEF